MSSFTITDGGGLAAGQGIGEAIKAFVLADGARQRAAMESGLKAAQMANQQTGAEKAATEAAILAERLGLMRDPMKAVLLEHNVPLSQRGAIERYQQTGGMAADGMGPPEPPPIDPQLLARINKSLGLSLNTNMTGSNVQQMANARSANQMSDITQGVLDGSIAPTLGAQARFAGHGGSPVFQNVGSTGVSMNSATGSMDVGSKALLDIFEGAQQALKERREAAAEASKASANASNARAEATRESRAGQAPGAPAGQRDRALTSTIINTLKVPKLDEKGRPVVNPLTGAREMEVDQNALRAYYGWIDANDLPVSDKSFARWEAQGRPGANKSPSPGQPGGTIGLPKGTTPEAAREQARAAIAKGKDRAAVLQRLKDWGVSTEGL